MDFLIRPAAIAAIVLSLGCSAVLAFLHHTLGGPGDELLYYAQAARLSPFVDHYYGPGYFVALRLLKSLTGMGWFEAGKLLSWLSAAGFLIGSYRLLPRVLPGAYGFAAVILVALNPTLIAMSYSSLTVMLGAALLIAATLALLASETRPRLALLSGFLFALAALTRFQANAFFLGALGGLLLWNGAPFRRRAIMGGLLLIAFVVPMAGWSGYLAATQGGAPANYNFVHLTIALGRFQEFSEVNDLIRTYGSMSGLLRTPGAPMAIARMLAVETVKFPFRNGVDLLLLASAWLVPAVCIVAAQRTHWRPWLLALAAGFLATNLGSRGWVYYYLPVLPALVFLVCITAQAIDRAVPLAARRLQWLVIAGILIVATPLRSLSWFHQIEWPEWQTARRYLEKAAGASDLVTSTAGSLPYGMAVPFIDQDRIYHGKDLDRFVPALRQAGVTRVVVTDRHTLDEHPELAPLLADDPSGIPPGLRRDTLLTAPHRLAILTVSPP